MDGTHEIDPNIALKIRAELHDSDSSDSETGSALGVESEPILKKMTKNTQFHTECRNGNKTDDDKIKADKMSSKHIHDDDEKRSKTTSHEQVTIAEGSDGVSPRSKLPDLIPDVSPDSFTSTMNDDMSSDSEYPDTPPPLPDSEPPVLQSSETPPPLPLSSPPLLVKRIYIRDPSHDITSDAHAYADVDAAYGDLLEGQDSPGFSCANQHHKTLAQKEEREHLLSDNDSDSTIENDFEQESSIDYEKIKCDMDIDYEVHKINSEVAKQRNSFENVVVPDNTEISNAEKTILSLLSEFKSKEANGSLVDFDDEFEAIFHSLNNSNTSQDPYIERFAGRRDKYGFILSPIIESPSPTPSSMSGYSGLSSASPDPFSMFRVSPAPRSGKRDIDLSSLSKAVREWDSFEEEQTIPIYQNRPKLGIYIPETTSWESDNELTPTSGSEWDPFPSGLSTPPASAEMQFGSQLKSLQRPDNIIYEENESSSAGCDSDDSDDTLQGSETNSLHGDPERNGIVPFYVESSEVNSRDSNEMKDRKIRKDDHDITKQVSETIEGLLDNIATEYETIITATKDSKNSIPDFADMAEKVHVNEVEMAGAEFCKIKKSDQVELQNSFVDLGNSQNYPVVNNSDSDSEECSGDEYYEDSDEESSNESNDEMNEYKCDYAKIDDKNHIDVRNFRECFNSTAYIFVPTSSVIVSGTMTPDNIDCSSSVSDEDSDSPNMSSLGSSGIKVSQYTSGDSESNDSDTETNTDARKENNSADLKPQSIESEIKKEAKECEEVGVIRFHSPLDFSFLDTCKSSTADNTPRSPRVLGRHYLEMDQNERAQCTSPPTMLKPGSDIIVENNAVISNQELSAIQSQRDKSFEAGHKDEDLDETFKTVQFKMQDNSKYLEYTKLEPSDKAADSSDSDSDEDPIGKGGIHSLQRQMLQKDEGQSPQIDKTEYVQRLVSPNTELQLDGKESKNKFSRVIRSPVKIKIAHLQRQTSSRNKIRPGYVKDLSKVFTKSPTPDRCPDVTRSQKKMSKTKAFEGKDHSETIFAKENIEFINDNGSIKIVDRISQHEDKDNLVVNMPDNMHNKHAKMCVDNVDLPLFSPTEDSESDGEIAATKFIRIDPEKKHNYLCPSVNDKHDKNDHYSEIHIHKFLPDRTDSSETYLKMMPESMFYFNGHELKQAVDVEMMSNKTIAVSSSLGSGSTRNQESSEKSATADMQHNADVNHNQKGTKGDSVGVSEVCQSELQESVKKDAILSQEKHEATNKESSVLKKEHEAINNLMESDKRIIESTAEINANLNINWSAELFQSDSIVLDEDRHEDDTMQQTNARSASETRMYPTNGRKTDVDNENNPVINENERVDNHFVVKRSNYDSEGSQSKDMLLQGNAQTKNLSNLTYSTDIKDNYRCFENSNSVDHVINDNRGWPSFSAQLKMQSDIDSWSTKVISQINKFKTANPSFFHKTGNNIICNKQGLTEAIECHVASKQPTLSANIDIKSQKNTHFPANEPDEYTPLFFKGYQKAPLKTYISCVDDYDDFDMEMFNSKDICLHAEISEEESISAADEPNTSDPNIFQYTFYDVMKPIAIKSKLPKSTLTQSDYSIQASRNTVTRNNTNANHFDNVLPVAKFNDANCDKCVFDFPGSACHSTAETNFVQVHSRCCNVNSKNIDVISRKTVGGDRLSSSLTNVCYRQNEGVYIPRRLTANKNTHETLAMNYDAATNVNTGYDTRLHQTRINENSLRETQDVFHLRMPRSDISSSKGGSQLSRDTSLGEKTSDSPVLFQSSVYDHIIEDDSGRLKGWPYSDLENQDRVPVKIYRTFKKVSLEDSNPKSQKQTTKMRIVQAEERSAEMPADRTVKKIHSSSVLPANTTEKELMKSHAESIQSALQTDANGNMLSEEEIAKVLPKLAETVSNMKNVNAEEIMPGITQTVAKLKDGGNLVITTMTRKVTEDEEDETSEISQSHPVLDVDDLENSKIYLVQDSKGELFYVEDVTSESQESAYFSSSRHTSESVSDSGSSPTFQRISKIKQVGNSGINEATAEELISAMYDQNGITEIDEFEDEYSERTYEFDLPKNHGYQDSLPKRDYSKDSFKTSYMVEEPDSSLPAQATAQQSGKTTTRDHFESSYEMTSGQPWVFDGAAGQYGTQGNYSHGMQSYGEEIEKASTLSESDNVFRMQNLARTSEASGSGHTITTEKYTIEAEAFEYPETQTDTTVYAAPPAVYVPPPAPMISGVQTDEQQNYSLVKVDMTPKSVVSKMEVPPKQEEEEKQERPIYKTVAHIETKERPRPKPIGVDMTDSKRYKIITTKPTPTEEVQESHMAFDEVDYRMTTENIEYKLSSPTYERKQYYVRNSTGPPSPESFRSEKRLELNQGSNQRHKTEIQVNDTKDYDAETYEENSYSYDKMVQNMENTDMKVVRGSYLIKNTLDEVDGSLDDNLNMFDGNFTLRKDNPLFQSDEDIYKRYEREKAENARKQERFQRDVNQDITFETVDKFSKSKTVKKEERPKQSLSELLLSRLSTIEAKDIRQHIDVKHHAEDIYGDPSFLHADGSLVRQPGTNNFDTVGEKVDLLLKEGKAFITVTVTAERITPVDLEFNVWRKNQAIVTRVIEVDLLATEQRRRLYYQVMEEPGSKSRGSSDYRVGPNETVLDSQQTLELFTRILGAADGEGDKEDITVKTRQSKTTRPFSSGMDLLY